MKNKLLVLGSSFALVCAFGLVSLGQGKCTEEGSIRSVTKARWGSFETVTFLVNSATPDYEVKTEKPPFQEYAEDKNLRIAGKYFKSVYFKSVMWTCRIAESLKSSSSNISAVRNIEQFEGYVNYIIGYKKKGSYVGTTASTAGKQTKIIVKFKR